MCSRLYFVHSYIKFNADKVLHCKMSAGGTGKVKGLWTETHHNMKNMALMQGAL